MDTSNRSHIILLIPILFKIKETLNISHFKSCEMALSSGQSEVDRALFSLKT